METPSFPGSQATPGPAGLDRRPHGSGDDVMYIVSPHGGTELPGSDLPLGTSSFTHDFGGRSL
jgi:hypothetical protein